MPHKEELTRIKKRLEKELTDPAEVEAALNKIMVAYEGVVAELEDSGQIRTRRARLLPDGSTAVYYHLPNSPLHGSRVPRELGRSSDAYKKFNPNDVPNEIHRLHRLALTTQSGEQLTKEAEGAIDDLFTALDELSDDKYSKLLSKKPGLMDKAMEQVSGPFVLAILMIMCLSGLSVSLYMFDIFVKIIEGTQPYITNSTLTFEVFWRLLHAADREAFMRLAPMLIALGVSLTAVMIYSTFRGFLAAKSIQSRQRKIFEGKLTEIELTVGEAINKQTQAEENLEDTNTEGEEEKPDTAIDDQLYLLS